MADVEKAGGKGILPEMGQVATGLRFGALKAAAKERAALGAKTSSLASNMSVLNRFMLLNGLKEDDSVHGWLGGPDLEFAAKLQEFEDKCAGTIEAIGSYRSRLRGWHLMARGIRVASASRDVAREELRIALESYMGRTGRSRHKVELEAGLHSRELVRLLDADGVMSIKTEKAVARINRLANLLGMDAAVILRLYPDHWGSKAARRSGRRTARGITARGIRVCPKEDPPAIAAFKAALITHKTTDTILLTLGGEEIKPSRHPWRLRPERKVPVPSAAMVWGRFRTLIGWLLRPATIELAKEYAIDNLLWLSHKDELTGNVLSRLARELVGEGVTLDQISVGHLIDPKVLAAHVTARKSRRAAITSELAHVEEAISWLEPKNGFVARQVELVWDYPALGIEPVDMAARDAAARYAEAKAAWAKAAAKWLSDLKELRDRHQQAKSTRVREKLLPVLRHLAPMTVIDQIIARHHADRPAGRISAGKALSIRQALWIRDQLLLRTLASNPLRSRNFCEMRYIEGGKADSGGNLYRMPSGEWRLRFLPEDFKNEHGAARELYDVMMDPSTWPLVDQYINQARPVLLHGREIDEAFVSVTGRPLAATSLASAVKSLTGAYIDENLGMHAFGPHAFRHIVATAWLRANPGDYLTVAHILHDTLETVLKNYAHNTPNDGLRLFSTWLSGIIQPFSLAA